MSRPKLSLIIFLYCSTWPAWAQQPIINFVDKTSGNLNEIVIISGNGFSNTPGDLMVFFGSVQGEIVSSTDLIIEARVPSGSIYSPITVTNLTSNLIGYSNPQFFMNFGGNGFDATLKDPAVDFRPPPGPRFPTPARDTPPQLASANSDWLDVNGPPKAPDR